MDLTAEGIKSIVKLGAINSIKDDKGNIYSDVELRQVKPRIDDRLPTMTSTTLSSLIDFISSNVDELDYKNMMIHVRSFTQVDLVSQIIENGSFRNIPFSVNFEWSAPNFIVGFKDLEDFNIWVQTSFELDENARALLQIVGNYKKEESVRIKDDGITQSVTAKTGVSMLEEVDLPNPVMLRKIVTFPEIEQPQRPFVFRMNTQGHAGLFTTESDLWHVDCILSIKKWLLDNLKSIDMDIPVIG
jgi:hypothetical protein